MKKIATVLVAALLCTCIVAGCGNNGGSTSSSSASVSAADKGDESSTQVSEKESDSDEQSVESTAESSSENITGKNYRELDAEYTVENGVIVVNQDGHYRGVEMFGGGSGDAYVDTLNTLRTKLDSSIRIYSMIAPLACQYYIPSNYEDYTADQKEYIDDNISARLSDGITAVDIVSTLGQHTEENIRQYQGESYVETFTSNASDVADMI